MLHAPNNSGSWNTAARSGARDATVDVVALTTDQSLLATLQEAAGALQPPQTLWVAASAEAAVDLLVAGRIGVLLADLSLLRGNLHTSLERLLTQFPELVFVAMIRRGEDEHIAGLISDGKIYRVLHKPVSPARATLFLGAATRRYRDLKRVEPTPPVAPALEPHQLKGLALVVVAALLIVAAAIWWPRNRAATPAPAAQSEPAPPVMTTIAATPPPSAAPKVDKRTLAPTIAAPVRSETNTAVPVIKAVRFVDLARAHLQADQLLAPDNDNALYFLRRAARAGTSAEEISAVATELTEALLAHALNAAAAHNDAALQWMAAAQTVNREFDLDLPNVPANPEVAAAEAKESALRSTADLLASARTQREAGNLIAPEGSSAYDVLLRLRATAASTPEYLAEQQRLAFAFIEAGRRELQKHSLDSAQLLADRAEKLLPGMATTQKLRDDIAAARTATSP